MPPLSDTVDQLLARGVDEIINRNHLAQRLRRRRPLRVKFGIDPTGHDVHLGHAVPLRKLRQFQEAGHIAVLIIGDFTARIGDPSGRDAQRRALSAEMVGRYASTYLDQIGSIIDMRRAEVRYNSEWFERMHSTEILELIGPNSLPQLLAHDTFRRRLDAGQALSVLEILYPILQGYDSVVVQADVELGGADQKFNLLMGREIQTRHNQEPQDVILTPYLTGLDGKRKMSKSEKNYIGIAETANEMFGKLMSIPDKLIPEYLELASDFPTEQANELTRSLKKKSANPRDAKAQLAKSIVRLYHNTASADQAETEFTKIFRHKQAPTNIPSIIVRPGRHPIINLLVGHQIVASRSEARRLIEQGGVKYKQQPVTDWEATITAEDGALLQIGKRKFIQLQLTT